MSFVDSVLYAGGYLFFIAVALIALIVYLEKYHLGGKEFALYGGKWSVAGKVVVITGASSGIGEEMAKQCAAAGAHLVLAARRVDRLAAVEAECLKVGAASVLCVGADVSVEADCKKVVDAAAAKHGGVIDCVFANAGLSMAGNLDTQKDLSIYNTLMGVNFFGVLWTVAYALPALKKAKNAKIIILSSIQGRITTPGRTGYHASKYALHGFGDSLRQELFEHGVSVLLACPGPVKTDINASRLGSEGGAVGLDMKKAMSVYKCVNMILAAAACHQREELFVPLQKLGPILSPIVPRTTELVARLKQRQLHTSIGDAKKDH